MIPESDGPEKGNPAGVSDGAKIESKIADIKINSLAGDVQRHAIHVTIFDDAYACRLEAKDLTLPALRDLVQAASADEKAKLRSSSRPGSAVCHPRTTASAITTMSEPCSA
jgi:hypothetical protein